jgi:hypothetical protein
MTGDLLRPLEGCIDRPGPGHGEVILVQGAADLVERFQHGRHVVRKAVLRRHVVQRADQSTFRAAAVVAERQDDERIVGVRTVRDGVENAPNLLVRLRQEAGEDFHLTSIVVGERWNIGAGGAEQRERLVCTKRTPPVLPGLYGRQNVHLGALDGL